MAMSVNPLFKAMFSAFLPYSSVAVNTSSGRFSLCRIAVAMFYNLLCLKQALVHSYLYDLSL